MITNKELREFLEDDLAVDTQEITDDCLLFSSGIVDSFALVTLMTFLEDEADIKVAASEVTLDNMDSIGRVLSYLQSKQQSAIATT